MQLPDLTAAGAAGLPCAPTVSVSAKPSAGDYSYYFPFFFADVNLYHTDIPI
ncbi:hypothetical protein [Paucidesulfovibrio gracilis]|uniref:hypothetical protein n=1 Tax=Paucidesulfovibrio gracilis TaxID=47158 RepID=UPI00135641BC|nr:hypothetical protein [Paucidesulfovibrio gracilis]